MIDKIDRERIHEEINERKKIIAKKSQEMARKDAQTNEKFIIIWIICVLISIRITSRNEKKKN
jgi:hypothetical protein